MIGDPIDELVDAAWDEPAEAPQDDVDSLVDKAWGQEPSKSPKWLQYAAEPGAGLVQGLGGILKSVGATETGQAVQDYSREGFDPDVEQSLGGRVARGAGAMLPIVGLGAATGGAGAALGLGEGAAAMLGTAAAAGSIGSEMGQEATAAARKRGDPNPVAEGVLTGVTAGALNLLPMHTFLGQFMGRVVKADPDLAHALTKAALGVGAGAVSMEVAVVGTNDLALRIRRAIGSKEEARSLLEHVKDAGLEPALVGAIVSGASMVLHQEPGRDAEATAQGRRIAHDEFFGTGAASAESTPKSGGLGTEAAPTPLKPIEIPDDDVKGAVDRFFEQPEVHGEPTGSIQARAKIARQRTILEAPEALRTHAGKIGAKVVLVDAGEPLAADGYYDQKAKTIVLDAHSSKEEQRSAVLEHELVHFAADNFPDVYPAMEAAIEATSPGWLAKRATDRQNRQKAARGRKAGAADVLPAPVAREEAVAETVQSIPSFLRLADEAPQLAARIAIYRPGVLTRVAELLSEFARAVGFNTKPTVRRLLREVEEAVQAGGTDLEKGLGGQAGLRLALKLRELQRSMLVEVPIEQPRSVPRGGSTVDSGDAAGEAVRVRGRGAAGSEELPGVPRGVDEGLPQGSALDRGAASEDERSGLRARVSEAGQADGEAVRGVRRGRGADASRGLREAAGGDLAVPPVSPEGASAGSSLTPRQRAREAAARVEATQAQVARLPAGNRRRARVERRLTQELVELDEARLAERRSLPKRPGDRVRLPSGEEGVVASVKESGVRVRLELPEVDLPEDVTLGVPAARSEVRTVSADMLEKLEPRPEPKVEPAKPAARPGALDFTGEGGDVKRTLAEAKGPPKKELPIKAKKPSRFEKSQARVERKLAAAQETGGFVDWVRTLGGMAFDPELRNWTNHELGLNRARRPIVHAKGTDRGLHWDKLLALAHESGWFPERELGDLDLNDLLDLMDRNALHPDYAAEEVISREEARLNLEHAQRMADRPSDLDLPESLPDWLADHPDDLMNEEPGGRLALPLKPKKERKLDISDLIEREREMRSEVRANVEAVGRGDQLVERPLADPSDSAQARRLQVAVSAFRLTREEKKTFERGQEELAALDKRDPTGKGTLQKMLDGEPLNVAETLQAQRIKDEDSRRAYRSGTAADLNVAIATNYAYAEARSQASAVLRAATDVHATPEERFFSVLFAPSAKARRALSNAPNQAARQKILERETAKVQKGLLALARAGFDPRLITGDYFKSPRTLARMADIAARAKGTFWDWWYAWKSASLQAGTLSALRNPASNAAHIAYDNILSRALSAHPSETRQYLADMISAIPDALGRATEAWLYNTREGTSTDEVPMAPNWLGLSALEMISTRINGAQDVFFRDIVVAAELRAAARSLSKETGRSVEDYLLSPELIEEAQQKGKKAVFADRDRLTRALIGLRDYVDIGGFKPGKDVVPFLATPSKIVQAAGTVALGPTIPIGRLLLKDMARSDQMREMGRALAGVGLWAAVYALANQDDEDGLPWLTGSRQLGGKGQQQDRVAPAYSFRSPFTGSYVSYQSLDPFGTALPIMLDVMRGEDSLPASIAKTLKDKTFFRGVQNLYEAATDEGHGKLARYARSTLWTPMFPNVLRSTAARAEEARTKELGPALEPRDLAYAATGMERFAPPLMYDRLGRPVLKAGRSWFARMFDIFPVTRAGHEIEPLDLLLWRYNDSAEKPVVFDAPSSTFVRRGQRIEMDEAEYSLLTRESGQRAMRVLRPWVLTRRAFDADDIEYIRGVFSRFDEQMRNEVVKARTGGKVPVKR